MNNKFHYKKNVYVKLIITNIFKNQKDIAIINLYLQKIYNKYK